MYKVHGELFEKVVKQLGCLLVFETLANNVYSFKILKEKSAKQFGEQKVNMSFFFPLLQSVHLLNYFDMLWRVGELVTYFLGTRLRDLF